MSVRGAALAPEGRPLAKFLQVPPPRPAPPGPTATPTMGRRRLLLLRVGVVVGTGESARGGIMAPEWGPLVKFSQGDPLRPGNSGMRAPLAMGAVAVHRVKSKSNSSSSPDRVERVALVGGGLGGGLGGGGTRRGGGRPPIRD